MNKKEYRKAIDIVDQANARCSIQLPLEMAVVYSVSLLHTGRGQDVCNDKQENACLMELLGLSLMFHNRSLLFHINHFSSPRKCTNI